jgi:hypothetical protein
MTEHCGSCKFHQADSNVCRRYPPAVSIFPLNRDAKTGAVEFTAQSAFPNTDPTHGWCGEFKIKLVGLN